MTKAFQEAIDAGKAILKDKWQRKHVTFDRQFGITELRCPSCGVAIAKLLPVGAQKITRIKSQTIIQEGMSLAYLANYREVLMQMNDGSRHVMNCCVECAALASDPATAVAMYAANLSQWSSEGAALSDAMCDRSPTEVLKVDDYIKE